ncbi:MAG: hypothetical protein K2U26_00780, partial [Cyclobacteriaceae bacterium]|nr:hypothetical protein [Cyclobacteriaceae bacterium]
MKSKIFFLLASLTCAIAHAQDIPVDLTTGKAQISIPLWELSTSTVKAPIGIVYNGGGVKVTDGGGSAGMGWSLQAGGQVTRNVRGLPDDMIVRGWLSDTRAQSLQSFLPTADNNLANCDDELADANALHPIIYPNGYVGDTEPDLFTVQAPGLSVQFIFDQNGVIRLIPYQDLKFQFTRHATTRDIVSFTVTRNDGTVYNFNLARQTSRKSLSNPSNFDVRYFYNDYWAYDDETKFNYTWLLSSIVDPVGQTVSFSYNLELTPSYKKERRYILNDKAVTSYTLWESPKVTSLTSMSDATTMVNFSWSPYGHLATVEVMPKNTNNPSKLFSLIYTRIRNQGSAPDNSTPVIKTPPHLEGPTYEDFFEELETEPQYRFFLVELRETGTDCLPFPSHKFQYYNIDVANHTTQLPFKNQYAQDLWGYYNGLPDVAASLVPRLYEKPSATGMARVRINPHPTDAGYVVVAGADRSTNEAFVHYGSLQRITYPSGGFGEITYEAADYYDSLVNTTYKGGGVRVKSIRISDADADNSNDIIRSYDYKRTDGHSSGKFLYPPVFHFYRDILVRSPDNLAPSDELLYSRVTVTQAGRGKTVYDFSLPGTFQQNQVRDWKAPFSKVARTKQAVYQDVCETIDPPPYEVTTTETRWVCDWEWELQRWINCRYEQINVTNTIDPDPTTTCINVQVGVECPPHGLAQNDYYSYPFAPTTNFDFERGLVQRVSDYNETGGLYQQKTFSYQRLGAPIVIKALKHERLPILTFALYDILANVTKTIVTETSVTYDPQSLANGVTRQTQYAYSGTHQLLNQISTTNSDGVVQKTRLKYAKDYASITSPANAQGQAIKSLNDNNRHGTLIESIQSVVKGVTETVTGAQLTLYKQFTTPALTLPYEQRSYNGTTGFAEAGFDAGNSYTYGSYRPVTYLDSYDNQGRLLVARDLQGIQSSTVLDAESYIPKATVRHARYDEVVINNLTNLGPTYNANNELIYSQPAPNPWSKEFSISYGEGSAMSQLNVVKASGKYYKFSCQVRAAAAITITANAINGGITKGTGQVNYPVGAAGTWRYLEVLVDMTNVASPFTFEVRFPAAVDFDYVAFYPQKADVTSMTIDPVIGKTSQTNTNGQNTSWIYDSGG